MRRVTVLSKQRHEMTNAIIIISNFHLVYSPLLHRDRYGGRRSQWPRGLRRRSRATRLLRLWVQIPPGGGGHGWLSVVSVVCFQVEVYVTR